VAWIGLSRLWRNAAQALAIRISDSTNPTDLLRQLFKRPALDGVQSAQVNNRFSKDISCRQQIPAIDDIMAGLVAGIKSVSRLDQRDDITKPGMDKTPHSLLALNSHKFSRGGSLPCSEMNTQLYEIGMVGLGVMGEQEGGRAPRGPSD
jgi:hypothetical protein